LPDVQFEFVEDFNINLRNHFNDGSLDLWVTGSPYTKYPELNNHFLCQEEIFLAIPPNHPLQRKICVSASDKRRYITYGDLQGQSFFMCLEKHTINEFVHLFLKQHHITAHFLHYCVNIVTALSGAVSVNALAFVPAGFAILNNDISYVSLGPNGTYWYVNLFYKSFYNSAVNEVLINCLNRFFENPRADFTAWP
jgi:DNA-binding transcriptional LysR family regulator